jgi:hypothetical protein
MLSVSRLIGVAHRGQPSVKRQAALAARSMKLASFNRRYWALVMAEVLQGLTNFFGEQGMDSCLICFGGTNTGHTVGTVLQRIAGPADHIKDLLFDGLPCDQFAFALLQLQFAQAGQRRFFSGSRLPPAPKGGLITVIGCRPQPVKRVPDLVSLSSATVRFE